jgi:signal transduction histidine kinase
LDIIGLVLLTSWSHAGDNQFAGFRYALPRRILVSCPARRIILTIFDRQPTSPLAQSAALKDSPSRITRVSSAAVDLLTHRPKWRPWVSIGLILGMITVVGIVDYATTAFISFRPFYFVPIALAVSWLGWRAGATAALIAVGVWIVGDYNLDSPSIRGPGFAAVWNSGIALFTFLLMVWTLQVLIALQREMENRVRERTRSLEEAVALQERLRGEMVEVGMRERNAVGRELHDGLCQHLAATAFAAQVHADRLSQTKPDEAENARALVQMTQQAITQSRRVASGLLLAGITPTTLASELNDFATEISRQGAVACRFEQNGRPCAPDSDTASQIFRIAQEAVRNALKHAKATAIRVILAGDERQMRLSVMDDGVGIPPPERRDFGMGLEIMAHRAGSIGASFSVEAMPQGGTRVLCYWARSGQPD